MYGLGYAALRYSRLELLPHEATIKQFARGYSIVLAADAEQDAAANNPCIGH
jgi:hypothetical protein